MSETPTPGFKINKAAVIAGGILGIGLLGAAGSAVNNANHHNDAVEAGAARVEQEKAYHDAVEVAVNAAYDRKDVVDEIHVTQGGPYLITAAEDILKASLGAEVYTENRGRLYELLEDSAQVYTSVGDPQPGSTFYVVETDFDRNPDNGKEYIVTDGSGGIIEAPTDTIPSPQQIGDE